MAKKGVHIYAVIPMSACTSPRAIGEKKAEMKVSAREMGEKGTPQRGMRETNGEGMVMGR